MYRKGQMVIERTRILGEWVDRNVVVVFAGTKKVVTSSGLSYTTHGTNDGRAPIAYRSIRSEEYVGPILPAVATGKL